MPRYQNGTQDERIKNVEGHIATINDELGSVKIDVAKIRTDMDWLKKTYWIVVTASVGGLFATLFNLFKQ